jgi:hypothetical protein
VIRAADFFFAAGAAAMHDRECAARDTIVNMVCVANHFITND